MKLKINTWTSILDIVNCILFSISWLVFFSFVFSDPVRSTQSTYNAAYFFYFVAFLGIALNIYTLVKSRKVGISIVGPVLGIIGNALFVASATLAFPAVVILIIAAVFTMLQHS